MAGVLTLQQQIAGAVYLLSLKSATERGRKYFAGGRVLETTLLDGGPDFSARVRGEKIYAVKLFFSENQWDGVCECPVGEDCKHCAAAMAAMLDANAAGLPRKAESKGSPAAIPRPAKKPVAQTQPRSFAVLIAEKLARKLTPAEKRIADAVDVLYRKYSQARLIAEIEFNILAARQSWQWTMLEVWPEKPRNPWEAWLYLVALLKRKNWTCAAPALLEATDPAEVQALTAEWEQQLRVAHWRDWLQKGVQQRTAPPQTALRELRVRLTPLGVQLEVRKQAAGEFAAMKQRDFSDAIQAAAQGHLPFAAESLDLWHSFQAQLGEKTFRPYTDPATTGILNRILRHSGLESLVVGPGGTALQRAGERLAWQIEPAASEREDYRLRLARPDGSPLPPALIVVDGAPPLYVSAEAIFTSPPLAGLAAREELRIPAAALETASGATLFDQMQLALPARIAERVRTVHLQVIFRCAIKKDAYGSQEHLLVSVRAETERGKTCAALDRNGWGFRGKPETDDLVRYDRTSLEKVPPLLESLRLHWDFTGAALQRTLNKTFPPQFVEWLAALPPEIGLELDPLLASFREDPISARVNLDLAESGMDWFDLRVALQVADTTLTPEEIRILLDARGGFVRLGAKGWRRLQFALSTEDESQLADLGLNARDFSSQPQRLHALQLAGRSAVARLLPAAQAESIAQRARDIQTRVVPPVPAGLQAHLRPYQIEGFHFLAYLSTNRFGGILADDMRLGKTVQTLAWLLWLRDLPDRKKLPVLIVCPKSVTENWVAEAARFAPALRVQLLPHGPLEAGDLKKARAGCDLLVLNYTQLRLLQASLVAVKWGAVILDEAQMIKNPSSQTALAACALQAEERLALSGTAIENRLLDLWSMLNFSMPGVLGARAAFGRTFEQRNDPFARRRLSARVRPFVLRRTKNEVARDLPDRIEEDLYCEMEGPQATLYRAELKRARAALLGLKSAAELNKHRFNFLASLMRLRQICCHPALLGEKFAHAESAKLQALFEVLEPLVEEGHKVLVFSQFVEMLGLIRAEIQRREWPHFLLTGDTEERGSLVASFQSASGAAVFLISLRAGGFGLNLTAASYVVLFDPWWNPAVENQAIDRTHRIGQTSKVIAYRLLIKESIEEKIRLLQKQKSSLAADVLGEENFARSLTLDDFRFLLEE